MSGFNSYIDNLLHDRGLGPNAGTDRRGQPSGRWARDIRGNLLDTSQHTNKLRGRGKFGRDPQISQWDFLYGGRDRTPSLGLGDLFPRTVGTYRPNINEWMNDRTGIPGRVDAIRGLYGKNPWRNPQTAGSAGGSTGGYNTTGGGTTPGTPPPAIQNDGKSGGGGQSADLPGSLIDINDILDEAAEFAESQQSPSRTYTSPSPPAEAPTFGVEQTDMDKALRFAVQESTLFLQEAWRRVANGGVLTPQEQQTILELAEGPENDILQDLPRRLAEQLGFNRAQGANARRSQLKGLSANLGRTGVQRPGVAAQIVANASVPQRQAEAEMAMALQQNAYGVADSINLGQGQRRAESLDRNWQSRMAGLAGLGGNTSAAADIIGQRLFDPSNQLGEQYKYSSGLAEQQQGFAEFNARLGNALNKDYAEFSMDLRKQYEQWLYEHDLGQYAEQDGGEGILDYLKAGSAIAGLFL